MLWDLLILFVAGLLGGALNTLAGGGTFITFPALVFVGVPPVQANATNTFAACSGYLSGTFALRRELGQSRNILWPLIGLSVIGGGLGAWGLLQTPETVFDQIIPWLMAVATVLLLTGNALNRLMKGIASRHPQMGRLGPFLSALGLLALAAYGGFFNAGLGILCLSYLTLLGYRDIHLMNALKLLVSSVVALVAIVYFASSGAIAWWQGWVVMGGTFLGGYLAGHYGRNWPRRLVTGLVYGVSICTTLVFFVKAYG